MQALMVVLLIGMLGGIAAALQTPIASLISSRMGILESIFIVHLSGTVLAGLPLLAMRGGKLDNWRNVPFVMLWAGGFGLIVIAAVSYVFPRVGVATGLMIFVLGQLVMAMVVDHFGWFDLTPRSIEPMRMAGIAVMLLGIWLMVR